MKINENKIRKSGSQKEEDIDEDGRPLTIAAAQRIFHSNNNHIFNFNHVFHNKLDANRELSQK